MQENFKLPHYIMSVKSEVIHMEHICSAKIARYIIIRDVVYVRNFKHLYTYFIHATMNIQGVNWKNLLHLIPSVP